MTKYNRFSRRSFLAGLGTIAGFSLSGGRVNAAEEKQLNFYNWDTYIGETTLADFKSGSGVEVKMDLFGDNAELFAKLREGNPGYDVIVPTNDFVNRMWKANMLEPLDHTAIPNFKNIAPSFQDAAFDPGRQYSMPYMWGTMGIGYRESKVPSIDSWSAVWGEQSDQYAGRIAWISEPDSMVGMALVSLGYSFNSENPDEIQAAVAQLTRYKKNVKTIAEDNGQDLLASGEVDIAVEWNGDIAQLRSEDPDIKYVIPREGSYYWQDCLCIPKDAPHPQNAHAFINFLLDAEVGRDLAEYIEYATPNEAARLLTNESYRNNPAIFPPNDIIGKLEPSLYLSEERSALIERLWTQILSS
ncbi:spermidine/putrescine ABC transporter substrate-binding protein [Candidatus Persebacteraceae bacterium Df01]|jgi:spermidine/putrescine transport system substrate-binding protein|uniref:Putrescine-binding periplasmic protein n=1 Tax=Candidatus Doriopsillibacter californiensis TaxID=2970740 RepID=A0ABT7QJJ9_9GAMM|nr:spermidine/putrescine ABC transporter substrate-binding protein [Candidatus Persebacteraceae bacterium Df01]